MRASNHGMPSCVATVTSRNTALVEPAATSPAPPATAHNGSTGIIKMYPAKPPTVATSSKRNDPCRRGVLLRSRAPTETRTAP
ncbi:hypothetical protein GCM10023108_46750 [Saccharopolyspora hordei]